MDFCKKGLKSICFLFLLIDILILYFKCMYMRWFHECVRKHKKIFFFKNTYCLSQYRLCHWHIYIQQCFTRVFFSENFVSKINFGTLYWKISIIDTCERSTTCGSSIWFYDLIDNISVMNFTYIKWHNKFLRCKYIQ